MLRRGCGGLKHFTVKALLVQEAVRDYSIEVARISRDVMNAHVLSSPSSDEELRKDLTELNAFRIMESEAAELVDAGQCWIVRNSWLESRGL